MIFLFLLFMFLSLPISLLAHFFFFPVCPQNLERRVSGCVSGRQGGNVLIVRVVA